MYQAFYNIIIIIKKAFIVIWRWFTRESASDLLTFLSLDPFSLFLTMHV